MTEILNFSHDRNAPFERSAAELRDTIDAFAVRPELNGLYDHFERDYSLPRDVVRQQIRKYLEKAYDYKTCRFSEDLSTRKIAYMALRHIAYLLYVVFTSRKYGKPPKRYELICEWVLEGEEIDRLSRLIGLFGRENVLITTPCPVNKPGYNIEYRPSPSATQTQKQSFYVPRLYDREETLRAFSREMRELKVYADLSRRTGVNLLPVAGHIVNQYLYYTSIFKHNRAKYCIQERHYQTSAIKNFLFRKYGGKCSAATQKNIHQISNCGFYYDADAFFSLGNRTAERALDYGARIGQVVPVGSLFMEHAWFNGAKDKGRPDKRYDIVYLGINFARAKDNLDSYASFVDDYYETFRWLARLSRENPALKIGIKHHGSNHIDEKETDIIKGSNIETIDQKLNSYDIGFSSRCAVTYCSTMGYELIAHGLPVLFLDPDRRNVTWFSEKSLVDNCRVTTYSQFDRAIKDLLGGKNARMETDDICLNSADVSGRIYEYFRKEVKI